MPHLLKSTLGRLWPLAFLLLPGCGLDASVPSCQEDPSQPACQEDPDPREVTHFKPGNAPHHTAIFCDIPDMNFGNFPEGRRCATDPEKSGNPSLWGAAMALVQNFSSEDAIGIDTSEDAVNQLSCSSEAVAIGFRGAFPEGREACLAHGGNTLGDSYGSVAEACLDLCRDLNRFSDADDDQIKDFCQLNARPSTNASQPFDNACDDDDALLDSFRDNDPRRKTEAIHWHFTTSGAEAQGNELNTLHRTANTTGAFTFDEGGSAVNQFIDHGDGFLEVTANTNGGNRLFGLSTNVTSVNPAGSQDLDDFVDLASNNGLYIFADGQQQTGDETGAIAGAFAAYQDGDRIRISFTANPDGTTARIDFYLLPPAACQAVEVDAYCPLPAGMTPLFTIASATYPFRVDGWLDTKDGTLEGARMVRIQK